MDRNYVVKTFVQNVNNIQKNYQLCIKMYFLSLFPDIMEIAKLW